MLDVKPLTAKTMPQLERLFLSDRSANGCWCMWFIIAVKEYHQGGGAANEAKFKALAARSKLPLGVIAIRDGAPVGWAAAGPRSRYARAVTTPTMKSIDPSENDKVWLAPCLFVAPEARGEGIAKHLLEGAVALARKSGAAAIEGFPTLKLGSADRQVGTIRLFESCGFRTIASPSPNRALMRLDF